MTSLLLVKVRKWARMANYPHSRKRYENRTAAVDQKSTSV